MITLGNHNLETKGEGGWGWMCRSRQQKQIEILVLLYLPGSNLISIYKLEENDFGKNVP